MLHFFISIGVVFKSKILKNPLKCRDGFTLTNELFFFQGVEEFILYFKDKSTYFKDLEDEDGLKSQLFFNFIHLGVDWRKKTMIGLDFSCSGHQLRMIFNELTNEESFDYINLRGEESYVDMYSLLASDFTTYVSLFYENGPIDPNLALLFKNETRPEVALVEEGSSNSRPSAKKKKTPKKTFYEELRATFLNLEDLSEALQFLQRTWLKKSIMTSDYNCSTPTFIKYFEKSILATGSDATKEFYRTNVKKFRLILTGLHRLTKNISLLPRFKSRNTQKQIYAMIAAQGYKITLWDGLEVNFGVFSRALADKRIYLNSREQGRLKRRTQTIPLYSNDIDYTATKRSLPANLCHAIDASKRRAIAYYGGNDYGYFSVHDEY